jgi:hypothetical protein
MYRVVQMATMTPDHEIIAVGSLKLRHVLEIHPVDSGNGGDALFHGMPRV